MNNERVVWLALSAALALASGCKDEAQATPVHTQHAGAPPPAAPSPSSRPPGYAPVQVDEGRQQLLGIRTMAVRRQPIDKGIRTVGIVQSDETRTSHVHVKFEGF